MAAKCTAQQRTEILRLAQELGPLEAAKRKGVPPGTVTAWRCLENKRAKLAKPPEPPEPQKPAVSEPPKRLTGKKVARLYTPSEKAAALELVQQLGVSETHRKTGISRFSLYEWARIHEKAMQQKHLSDPLADQTPAKNNRDALVLAEWNKHPGLGPSQIRNQLRRTGTKISVRKVRMVMENNGYVLPKVHRKQAHDQRYKAIRPNQLWHMDFLQRHIHKQKISVLFIVDDESRFHVQVVGLHAAVLIYAPELAEAQTQLGAADHRLVLGLVSRIVRATQHASSLQLSQPPSLHATGQLRDLALRGSPRLGKDGSVTVVVGRKPSGLAGVRCRERDGRGRGVVRR